MPAPKDAARLAVGRWRRLWVLFALLPSLSPAPPAWARCLVEAAPAGPAAPFTRHLGKDCTQEEREARSVSADDVLAVLTTGRGVDLHGVVVTGDLTLDTLAPVSVTAVDLPSPRVRDAVMNQHLKEIRVISGPLSIRDSLVRGTVTTNLKDGMLVVRGPVTMSGTTFERMVDWSRTAFLEPVDFSQAMFVQNAFFIQSLFDKSASFEKTAFGPHSRFHKAVFGDSATFFRAGFNGLSEFLQVEFGKEALFAQAYFKMGTGFSGSRFGGVSDFSEAVFDREAFFTFAVFEKDAYFRRATFRADTNFSDAEFRGVDDFSKTYFNTEPRFSRTKVSGARPSPAGLQDPRFLYGIAAALLIFTVIFVSMLRKG